MSNSDIDEDDVKTVHIGIEQADVICINLNDLITCGKIKRNCNFYKFLPDVVEIMYHPYHEYDLEVLEFFNTITNLGGRRITNFIRRPINMEETVMLMAQKTKK